MTRAVEKTIVLACSVEHAFEVFTKQLDLWWPPGHRKFQGSTLSLETRVGGLFLEVGDDGEEHLMGEVIACDPPHHIAYTWTPGSIKLPTQVEIRFESQGEATRVDVVHREGDAALGDKWPSRVEIYTRSWDTVLEAFKSRAE